MEVETPFSEPAMTGRPANKMPLMDAVKTCFQKSFAIEGRASRSEYWWFTLFLFIAQIGLTIIDLSLGTPLGLLLLATIPASITVMIRRMHDLGKSGWMCLILIIPLLGALVFLYWTVSDGQPHANDYGAVPTNILE